MKKINDILNYVLDNPHKDLECEIRFNKITHQNFLSIVKRLKAKKYVGIKETLYSDNIKKREYHKIDSSAFKDLSAAISKMKTPYKTEYTKKTIANKGFKNKLYKMAVNIENNNVPQPKGAVTMMRHTFRVTSVCKFWQYDITAVVVQQNQKSNIIYEAELELKKIKTVKEAADELKSHIDIISTIIDCSITNLETEIKHSIYNAVVTLERGDLPLLKHARYTVVDKADGERRFLYFDNKGVMYHFNPRDPLSDKIKIQKGAVRNTLIDCELHNNTFYGFDLLFYDNVDVRNCNMDTRIKFLGKIMPSLKGAKYKFTVKKFYFDNVFKSAKQIWDERSSFPYELDGLIFTPLYGSYISNLPIFKYKPLPSIDVRIKYNERFNFTEFYANGYPIEKNGVIVNGIKHNGTDYFVQKIYLKKASNLTAPNRLLGVRGRLPANDYSDIVEIEYNGKWEFLRKRPDKERPNSYRTVISVIQSINDNITVDELSKIKWVKSKYDIAREHQNCKSNIGFNFAKNTPSQFSSYFMRFVYSKLFADRKVLCIGCTPNMASYLNNSTIVEPNCLQVFGSKKSEGYMGIIEANQNNTVIWGELNKTIIQYSPTKSIKKHDVIFVNVFEHLLFNKTTKRFDEKLFAANMKTLKKYADTIIGFYFDADKIVKHLADMDCILLRDSTLHPLHKIYLDNQKIKYKRVFGQTPTMVEIKSMPNSYYSRYRPLLYKKNVCELLPATCGTLSDFYKEFKVEHKLEKSELIMADIQGYFIAKI